MSIFPTNLGSKRRCQGIISLMYECEVHNVKNVSFNVDILVHLSLYFVQDYIILKVQYDACIICLGGFVLWYYSTSWIRSFYSVSKVSKALIGAAICIYWLHPAALGRFLRFCFVLEAPLAILSLPGFTAVAVLPPGLRNCHENFWQNFGNDEPRDMSKD